MKPVLTTVGRVVFVPYDPARTLLVFADWRMNPDVFRRLKRKLPIALRDKWNYWELPSRSAHRKKLFRLVVHTKVRVQAPKRRVLTRLRDMVWDRMIDKQGETLDGVPRYWQVPMAFTGPVISLYYVLGIRLGTLAKNLTQRTPDSRLSTALDTASLSTPRGPP